MPQAAQAHALVKTPLTTVVNVSSIPQRSPFRYPGGKTWFVPIVRQWLRSLGKKPKLLIEPFAGGAIVGLPAKSEAEIDGVRSGLGISDRGEVLYSALLYADTDEEVVVVADGLGGATASVIEGNYPIDFFTRYEKTFSTERAAITAADKLIEEGVSPAEVLA